MSLADDIINGKDKRGTYKSYKKEDEEENLADKIINGNYRANNSSISSKKRDEALPTATSEKKKMSLPVFTSNLFLSGAIKNKPNNENRWEKLLKAGEFEDGYQFGDGTKTVLGTGANLIGNVGAGIMTPFENVLDIGTNVLATAQDVLGFDEAAKRSREFANTDLSGSAGKVVGNLNPFGVAYNLVNGTPEKIINPYEIEYNKDKNIFENYANSINKSLDKVNTTENYEKSSVSGEYLNEIERQAGYTVGLMLGSKLGNTSNAKVIGNSKLGASLSTGNIGLNIAGKTLNLPTLAIAGGMAGGLQEANEKGDNVTELERWSKGISGGLVEGISEGLFGMFGVGGNEITDEIAKKVASRFSSSAGKTLAKIGVNATGEAIEEFLSYAGNFLIDNGIINKLGNTDFSSEWNWEEVGKQMALAFASATITSGGGTIIQNNFATKSAEEQLGRKLTSEEKARVTQAVIEEAVQEGIETLGNNQSNMVDLKQNNTNNQLNSEEQQITLQENKISQNPNMEQIDTTLPVINEENRIENNQDMLYNGIESEGDLNDQGRTIQGNSELFRERLHSSIYEKNLPKTENKYTKSEYSNWEQSIKPTAYSQLTTEQKQLKEVIKRQYGKDIVFFDGNEKGYNGGSSLNNPNNIYINRNEINEFGINKVAFHEIMESNIMHNQELKNDIIIPVIDTIIQDSNFQEQKSKFWLGQGENIPNDYMIAKDILCDRFSEMKSGESLDYDNVLSQETNMTIDFAIENFENSLNSNKLNTANHQQAPSVENNILDTGEYTQQQKTNQDEEASKKTQYNDTKQKDTSEDGKSRKHYKSIFESDQVGEEGKKKAKELYKTDKYTPISNIETISKANESINRNGVENTYISFKTKLNNNEKITLQDIAIGERLIQIYSQNGDTSKVNDIIQDVAILGTELGQQVQAFNLIKRASPEGQLLYLKKVVNRTNLKTNEELTNSKNNSKKNIELKVTDEMADRILKAKNQQELESIMTDIAVELGEQLPLSMKDKVRSWRYLSMLGNPKTHIKNLGANIFMNMTQQIKNKVAGGIEDVVGVFNKDLEKTKTLKFANKDQRNFAKQDAEYMKDKIDGGGKYDIKNMIQNNKRQFDNKLLDRIAKFNSDMLELEDNIFLKKAYKQSFQNYMSANNLSSSDMQDSSVLQKAREYASYQAQEATFHQFNSLAQRLIEIENKGGVFGKAVEAVLPFKKTPMNIAKSGIEYSPIGLAKSLTYDIAQLNNKTKKYQTQLENGTISKSEYQSGVSQLATKTIDNVAKGLTGTSIAILGYALANMGILKAGNDGKDDEFKEKEGEQEYSIRIGDYTYSLDWIAPSAIPMFIGATVHDLIHSSSNDESKNILNSFVTASAKAFEPMTEMSMLQGLTSAISSYEQGSSNMLFDLGASAVSSYAGQFVPTALGQVAKTIDPIERDTSSTEKGLSKKLDQFTRQQIAKMPGLSQILPARKDVWGNDKTRNNNVLARAYEVAISPYNKKKISEDATDKELLSVFEKSGENVLPGTPSKSLTINTKKYELTTNEYNEAKGKFGRTSKFMLDNLTRSTQYKQMSYEKKAEAISDVYSYAKEQIKIDYAKKHNLEYKESTLSQTVNAIKSFGGNTSNYFEYAVLTKDLEEKKDKLKVLSDASFSKATKEAIYKNSVGKQDNDYSIMEEVFKLESNGLNINDYLEYKQQELEADTKEDGTVNGKPISGSKKKKVQDYIYSIKGASYTQKTILYSLECKPFSKSDQQIVINFLEDLSKRNNREDMMEIVKRFKSMNIYKNGTFGYKN